MWIYLFQSRFVLVLHRFILQYFDKNTTPRASSTWALLHGQSTAAIERDRVQKSEPLSISSLCFATPTSHSASPVLLPNLIYYVSWFKSYHILQAIPYECRSNRQEPKGNSVAFRALYQIEIEYFTQSFHECLGLVSNENSVGELQVS